MTEQTRVIEIELPTKLTIGGPANRDAELSTAKWSADFLIEAALHGLKQRRSDKFSVTKSADGLDKAIEQLAELDKAIEAGTIPTGGGGGGSRLTAEEAGWIEYFKAKESPVKFKGKTPNGKTLDDYMRALTKRAIYGAIKSKMEGLDEQEQIEFHKTQVPLMIDKALPILRKREEALTAKGTPGWFIQVEKDKRAGVQHKDEVIAPLDIDF